jgi:tyrosine-protein phosphatase SIW14
MPWIAPNGEHYARLRKNSARYTADHMSGSLVFQILRRSDTAGVFLHLSFNVLSRRMIAIALAPLFTAAAGCSARHKQAPAVGQPPFAEKISLPGVRDFGKVSNFLYRGGQPKGDALEELRRLHIDTIVDLRGELPGLVENERDRAVSLRMRFINLPGSGWATPSDKDIAQFFDLLLERPRRTIFIHCWLGGDRSGMFIAAYRIAFDGWSPQQAIREMRAFHYLHFWHPNMARWVEKFPDRLAQSPDLASFRHLRTQS